MTAPICCVKDCIRTATSVFEIPIRTARGTVTAQLNLCRVHG